MSALRRYENDEYAVTGEDGVVVITKRLAGEWEFVILLFWLLVLLVGTSFFAWVAYWLGFQFRFDVQPNDTREWLIGQAWRWAFFVVALSTLLLAVWGFRVILRSMLPVVSTLEREGHAIRCRKGVWKFFPFRRQIAVPARLMADVYSGSGGGWLYRIHLRGARWPRTLLVGPTKVETKTEALENARQIVDMIVREMPALTVEERIGRAPKRW